MDIAPTPFSLDVAIRTIVEEQCRNAYTRYLNGTDSLTCRSGDWEVFYGAARMLNFISPEPAPATSEILREMNDLADEMFRQLLNGED
jgi:hypothetical protein